MTTFKNLIKPVFALLLTVTSGFSQAPLKSLSIADCVERTLKSGSQVGAAVGMVTFASGAYQSSRAALLPQVTANGSATDNFNPPSTTVPALSYSANISAQMLVFDFMKTPAKVAAAQKMFAAAKNDSAALIQNLILSTIVAYVNFYQARSVQDVATEAVAQAIRHVQTAQTHLDVGRGVSYSVIKAQVNCQNANLALLRAQNNVTVTALILENCIGTSINKRCDFADTLEVDGDLPSLDSAIALACASRPELAASRLRVAAAQSALDAANLTRLPAILASGSYGYKQTEAAGNTQWNIGASILVPLFAGGAITGSVHQAIGAQKTAEAAARQLLSSVLLDVNQHYAACVEAKTRIIATTTAVELSQAAYLLAQERFSLGSGSSLELSDAAATLETSKIALIGARGDYRIAHARLARAIGKTDPASY